MGAKDGNGYGSFRVNRRSLKANRVSAFLAGIISDLDDGSSVCHSCDNPSCVNPDHLWRGTQAENMQDMSAKGRHSAGKLTEQDVRYIKAFLAAGAKQRVIAKNFGVSAMQISHINTGKRWGHVKVTHAPQGVVTGAVLSGKPKAPRQEGF
jgi:hypothetical protein